MKVLLFLQTSQNVGVMAYLPFILILVIMYFLMIRPQAKRQKEKQKMLNALKKGDKIITIGGIHGTISGFKGKDARVVLLQIDPNTKISISRSSISSQTNNDELVDTIESNS
ncbi:MAG: preprotein translocase subunit YajC [Candidatus Neomarinimicrobiota bacterium]|mgnify:CR=1 FL=1|nr:preprotein translocase subunit YajC [Candidatus Neomarinimicrobiota bacterium]MEC8689880.1 preprotein translocase subunit YajC [Candidatus Neomarinimicrobiota bacterium]